MDLTFPQRPKTPWNTCYSALIVLLFSVANISNIFGEDPKPAILLIGDSTVKNGQGKGDGGLWGWGQVLGNFLHEEKITVVNRALGGRSSRSFLTEGLWEKASSELKPGDYVLIQFGHNDGGDMFKGTRPRASIKGNTDETQEGIVEQTGKQEVVHSYGWYLRNYVENTKSREATPIILSPIPRNMWKDGKVVRANNDYGKWAKEAAEAGKCQFIDLNEICAKHMEQVGETIVSRDYYTANDHTHTTELGAIEFAKCVCLGLSELADSPWKEFIKKTTTYSSGIQYLFQGNESTDKSMLVTWDTVYDNKRGYGLEKLNGISHAKDQSPGNSSILFSAKAEEGNHRVKITLGSIDSSTCTTIKVESRRLMIEQKKLSANEFQTIEFTVYVRTPKITDTTSVKLKDREQHYLHWDDKLTLEILGNPPGVKSIEILPAYETVTLFLAGDSTVTDQPYEPWNSWGQMLPCFFNEKIAVANYAESGESIRSSLNALRFEKIFSQIKPGDYLMLQFGHNDMKNKSPDSTVEYKNNLMKLIKLTRSAQAFPILVTSMERKAGLNQPTLGEYPQIVRDVAAELKVPMIDLQKMSMKLYQALGENLDMAFQDGTHHNNYGSYQLSKCVVKGLIDIKSPLADFLRVKGSTYDPKAPDNPQLFNLPASLSYDLQKPLGN